MRLQPNPHISIRFHVFIPCGLKRNRLNITFYCVDLQQGVARGGFVTGLTFRGLGNSSMASPCPATSSTYSLGLAFLLRLLFMAVSAPSIALVQHTIFADLL
jgi:hypothetical protein